MKRDFALEIKHEVLMGAIKENLLNLKFSPIGSIEAKYYSLIHLELQSWLDELESRVEIREVKK